MWLVLAHASDRTARELTERWPHGCRLVTPADVCAEDWAPEIDDAAAGPSGAALPGAVRGVITRLGGIGSADLVGVHVTDCGYAAAELAAFLLAWLDDCPVPVISRPEPGSLNGPAWSAAQWTLAAHRAGLAVLPLRLGSSPESAGDSPGAGADGVPSDGVTVTVIGDRVIGDVHPRLSQGAARLARAAGTRLLGVTFDGREVGSRFAGASVCPALPPRAAEALADQLGWTTC